MLTPEKQFAFFNSRETLSDGNYWEINYRMISWTITSDIKLMTKKNFFSWRIDLIFQHSTDNWKKGSSIPWCILFEYFLYYSNNFRNYGRIYLTIQILFGLSNVSIVSLGGSHHYTYFFKKTSKEIDSR